MSKLLLDAIHIFDNKREVILRITKFCNQKCLFCFTEIDNKTEISYEDIIIEIDRIISENNWYLLDFVITWWEPTLHKNFLDIIDYIYKKNHFITIQSNLVNFWINNKSIEKLIKYKNNISFFVSFHSHIPKIYDIITNTSNQFIYAKKWLDIIFENFNNITINIVINALNINLIKEYFIFLWNNYYKNNKNILLNISVMRNIYKYKKIEKLLVNYSDIVELLNSSKNILNKFNINIWSDFWWPCDLPYCIWNKLFYFNKKTITKEEKNNKYIDRKYINKCNSCEFKLNCSGILSLYLEKYWEEEFNK